MMVVVDNKKVTVRVNTTKVDPFYYNPLWDEEKPVTFLFRFTFIHVNRLLM